jgi:ribosome maturation factor RimP
MITKETVKTLVEEWLTEKGNYFLVDIQMDGDRIAIEIDHADGVWIEDCAELSRFLQDKLGEELGEYEMEVGSAGIGQPFKVLQQYINHIGQEVEVMPKSGAKIKGVLVSADDKGFAVKVQQKQKVEGSKRPKTVETEMPFGYDEVKYVKYVISLK